MSIAINNTNSTTSKTTTASTTSFPSLSPSFAPSSSPSSLPSSSQNQPYPPPAALPPKPPPIHQDQTQLSGKIGQKSSNDIHSNGTLLEKKKPRHQSSQSPSQPQSQQNQQQQQKQQEQDKSQIIIYPVNSGVIRCICGFSDDDGFTIQCERCNVWQHAVCVDIQDESQVPEVYLCDRCGGAKKDPEVARRLQLHRIHDARRSIPTGSIGTNPDATKSSKRKRSADDDKEFKRTGSEGAVPIGHARSESSASRRGSPVTVAPNSTSSTQDSSTLLTTTSTGNSTSNSNEKPTTSTRRGRSKRLTLQPPEEAADNDGEPEKKFTLSQMSRSYYVSISQNRFASPYIHKYVASLATAQDLDESTSYLSRTDYNTIELPSLSVKLTSDHPKQKFSGFSRFGLFLDGPVARDRFLLEYVGLVMPKTEYKNNNINQYRHFGCPKPGVLFHPSLPICIDARQVGSDARFLRRSCRPNCKVSTVIVDKKSVIFVVFALEPIKHGAELTLAWEWDERHPVQKLLRDKLSLDQLSRDERAFLVHSAEYINQRGSECACNLSPSECLIARMKKALGNPSRVTRTSAKTRRGGSGSILDGTNNAVMSADDADTPGSQDSDDPAPVSHAPISFYSKREARKLQSAMALFEKLSNEPPTKRRKTDQRETSTENEDDTEKGTPTEETPKEKQTDNTQTQPNTLKEQPSVKEPTPEPIKPILNYSEKSVQTNPVNIPLRKSLNPGSSQIILTSTSLASEPLKLRVFHKYLISKHTPKNPKRGPSSTLASGILKRALPTTITPPIIYPPHYSPHDIKRRSNGGYRSNQTFSLSGSASALSRPSPVTGLPPLAPLAGLGAFSLLPNGIGPVANGHSSQGSTPAVTPGASPLHPKDGSPQPTTLTNTGYAYGTRSDAKSVTPTPLQSPAHTPRNSSDLTPPPLLSQQAHKTQGPAFQSANTKGQPLAANGTSFGKINDPSGFQSTASGAPFGASASAGSVPPPRPTIKKKLSFADYMKKQQKTAASASQQAKPNKPTTPPTGRN
ncbi:uncharacterized protein SAPINGB_P005053 [Magnusiomyces paraingens]|uniref:SET domain-containing protein n=1 Tax=Magnusiomyces paraingens TaxID=2606893 RepID=A0A5E8C3Q9_9ASCO|nr:uncharacterized protein SAPINGB_P005053 [Saprochaete ingens]VVT56428.1 unnamed protein product [Saprochaete ingens]